MLHLHCDDVFPKSYTTTECRYCWHSATWNTMCHIYLYSTWEPAGHKYPSILAFLSHTVHSLHAMMGEPCEMLLFLSTEALLGRKPGNKKRRESRHKIVGKWLDGQIGEGWLIKKWEGENEVQDWRERLHEARSEWQGGGMKNDTPKEWKWRRKVSS